MTTLTAFLLGIFEFRRGFTTRTSYPAAYDYGRELAHRLTMRHFED